MLKLWIDKFRSGDFPLKDEQRSGRPNEVDDDQIELKEILLTKRFNACGLHLKHNELDPFVKRIITGNKKLIV